MEQRPGPGRRAAGAAPYREHDHPRPRHRPGGRHGERGRRPLPIFSWRPRRTAAADPTRCSGRAALRCAHEWARSNCPAGAGICHQARCKLRRHRRRPRRACGGRRLYSLLDQSSGQLRRPRSVARRRGRIKHARAEAAAATAELAAKMAAHMQTLHRPVGDLPQDQPAAPFTGARIEFGTQHEAEAKALLRTSLIAGRLRFRSRNAPGSTPGVG